jgi:predicted amidohydrolase YtcJ
MLADLVVLGRDPQSVPPADHHTLRADLTVIAGRVAFER